MVEVDHDLVKRLAELVDGDGWEIADLLVEKFSVEQYGDGGKANSELYEALDAAEDALRKEHGVELKVSTLRQHRATAIAWPHDARSSSASYVAHQRLRGKDRYDLMQRYLKRNQGRPLSKRDVQRYRADDKGPGLVLTPEERFEKRVRSTVKSALLGAIKPEGDWWKSSSISTEDREMAVSVLHQLANDLIGGLDG
jgi:hypothetical protein